MTHVYVKRGGIAVPLKKAYNRNLTSITILSISSGMSTSRSRTLSDSAVSCCCCCRRCYMVLGFRVLGFRV